MDFLKKVLYITAAYFIIVLLWLLFTGSELQFFLLGLQAFTFGVIAVGFLYFNSKDSSVSKSNGIKKDS